MLKPENFRRFDAKRPSSPIEIRTKAGSPLILIKGTGEVACARTTIDKDRLIARFDDRSDVLLWVWRRRYPGHTDVFQLSRSDLDRFYSKRSGRAANAKK